MIPSAWLISNADTEERLFIRLVLGSNPAASRPALAGASGEGIRPFEFPLDFFRPVLT